MLCALFFGWLLKGKMRPAGPLAITLAGALAYAGVVTSFVVSTRLTTAANTIILQYTSLVWIIVLAWMFVGERPRAREVAAVVCGFAGIGLCAGSGFSLWRQTGSLSQASVGDALALLSGLCFALTTLALRKLHHAAPDDELDFEGRAALVTLFYGNVIAALISLPALVSLPLGAGHQAPAATWLIIAWLGLAQLGGGYWFFQQGLKTTRALTANLLSLIEPVLNPLWVALLVGETPARGTFYGGLLILGAIILSLTGRQAEFS